MKAGTKWIIGGIAIAGFTTLLWPAQYHGYTYESDGSKLILKIKDLQMVDAENRPAPTTDRPVVRIRNQDDAGTVLSVQTKGRPIMYIGVTKEGKVVAYDEDSNQLLLQAKPHR